jgi:YD repeat-containing protein
MKKKFNPEIYLMALCALFLLSHCRKVKDIPKTPNLDTAILNAMYPASISINNNGQLSTSNYEYDKDNHLVKFGTNTLFSTIGTNQVDLTYNEYANNNGQTALIHVSTTSYIYTLAGLPNTSVNIYNTAPTQVNYTYYEKDVLSGVISSRPGGVSQFFCNSDGQPTKVIDNNTNNVTYTYDDKKNLTKMEVVRLSGPRAGALYQRTNFLSFDDKRSPFSAVKGYWPMTYPQSYNWNFALAFCKNNPKQTTTEIFDVVKNDFVPYETDDYTYVYNEKGYPTQVTVNVTYYTAVTTHFVYTYNYTYR